MFQTKPNHQLKTVADLARLLGLRPNAGAQQIASSFGAATRFEAWLDIEEHVVTARVDETWEIRITQAHPRPRVELRHGCRGPWLRQIQLVPEEVVRSFQLRPTKDGTMETLRSWKAWERISRPGGQMRRLRSRNGEIHAIVEIRGVLRETGERRTLLRIDPLADDGAEGPAPVRLPLPCTSGAIAAAVSKIQHACVAAAA